MKKRLSEATDRLTDLGFGAGWSLVKSMPDPVADRLFRRAADTAFRRRGPSVVQLAKNLNRVLGEQSTPESLSAVVQAGMRSYARYWKETFRLPAMDSDDVLARINAGTIGAEHIDQALEDGRGVILTVTHSGNWDAAGLWVTRRWGSLTTVVERLKPESLYEKFVSYRESLGMEILPLTGGQSPSQKLRERLKAGGIVALVGDRDLSASGVPVTFFGETAKLPPGPAMLAALTDAVVLPVNLSFTDHGWAQHIHPPVTLPGVRLSQQVLGGTRQIAQIFEQGITDHPADWHMLQPLWPSDLARTGSGGEGSKSVGSVPKGAEREQ